MTGNTYALESREQADGCIIVSFALPDEVTGLYTAAVMFTYPHFDQKVWESEAIYPNSSAAIAAAEDKVERELLGW